MKDNFIYIVTDGEFDGPIPGRHSMLSFASVAVTPDNGIVSEFEATLCRLEGAIQDEETMAFWKEHPQAYAATTYNPEQPYLVMSRFVDWVRSLSSESIFVSHPLAVDGIWFDFYLQRFTKYRLIEGFWRPDRLFKSAPLCLVSYAAGRLNRPPIEYGKYPPEWLGNHAHTHRAIDDARGYAHLLVHLMKMS